MTHEADTSFDRTRARGRSRGFTLVEMLVVVAIIAVLIGLLLPALRQVKRKAASLEDKSQVRQIHQAMLVFAGSNDGALPTPGLINRRKDTFTGRQMSGVGPEDFTKNTSANMYSAMLALELFDEELLISPVEVNPLIPPVDARQYKYDYSAYQPAQDIYWDGDHPSDDGSTPPTDRFRANIQDDESHTSYFHLALVGRRKSTKWRNTATQHDPALGSRAPYRGLGEGADAPDDYDQSYTLMMHGGASAWSGNIVFGDNHTSIIDTFTPINVNYKPTDGNLGKDNIFDMEFADPTTVRAADTFLTMTRTASEDEIVDYREKLR